MEINSLSELPEQDGFIRVRQLDILPEEGQDYSLAPKGGFLCPADGSLLNFKSLLLRLAKLVTVENEMEELDNWDLFLSRGQDGAHSEAGEPDDGVHLILVQEVKVPSCEESQSLNEALLELDQLNQEEGTYDEEGKDSEELEFDAGQGEMTSIEQPAGLVKQLTEQLTEQHAVKQTKKRERSARPRATATPKELLEPKRKNLSFEKQPPEAKSMFFPWLKKGPKPFNSRKYFLDIGAFQIPHEAKTPLQLVRAVNKASALKLKYGTRTGRKFVYLVCKNCTMFRYQFTKTAPLNRTRAMSRLHSIEQHQMKKYKRRAENKQK